MASLPHDLAHNPQTMNQQQNPTDNELADDEEWVKLVDPYEQANDNNERAKPVDLDDEEDVCEHCNYTGNIDCKVGKNLYYGSYRITCGHPTYSGGLVIGNVPINDPCIPKETVDEVLALLPTH